VESVIKPSPITSEMSWIEDDKSLTPLNQAITFLDFSSTPISQSSSTCPINSSRAQVVFHETKLLRLPSPHVSIFSFGTAMHEAMEVGQKNAVNKELDPGIIISAFEKALSNEPMENVEYERYLKHGTDVLTRILNEFHFEFDVYAKPEEKISIITKEGARLTGTIDVLHQDTTNIWFDDYKTGEPLKSLDPNLKTDAEKKWRIRTQIIFYYILLNDSKFTKNKKVTSSNVIYLEAEYKKDMVLTYTPKDEEISTLFKVIPKVWEHIQNLNFPDTSHYNKDYSGIRQFTEDLINGSI
jgi:hypothetical protein